MVTMGIIQICIAFYKTQFKYFQPSVKIILNATVKNVKKLFLIKNKFV